MTTKLLLATTNPGKLRELRALFALPSLVLTDPDQVGLRLDVEENGSTYLENARLKALAHAGASGLWAVADDTGLEVDALHGAPGLLSARAGSTDPLRRQALLWSLRSHPRPWRAQFRCGLVLAGPMGSVDGAEGAVAGEVVPEARGGDGFGYDPIFVVEGTGKTMAELDLHTKNHISHRARAAQALMPRLMVRLGIDEST